jgi:hypothetical protein
MREPLDRLRKMSVPNMWVDVRVSYGLDVAPRLSNT